MLIKTDFQWFNTSIKAGSNVNNAKITLPISFSKTAYNAQITDQDGIAEHGIDNLSLTQITIRTLSASKLGWGMIVIGQ